MATTGVVYNTPLGTIGRRLAAFTAAQTPNPPSTATPYNPGVAPTYNVSMNPLDIEKQRINEMYNRNMEELARQMMLANEELNANLEARGTLRSAESDLQRQRLADMEAMQRNFLTSDRDYQLSLARKPESTGGGYYDNEPDKKKSGGGTSWNPAPSPSSQDLFNFFNGNQSGANFAPARGGAAGAGATLRKPPPPPKAKTVSTQRYRL